MTPEQLRELKEAREAGSPGEWIYIHGYGFGRPGKSIKLGDDGPETADKELVVVAVNSLLPLVAEIERQKEALTDVAEALSCVAWINDCTDEECLCCVAKRALGLLCDCDNCCDRREDDEA